MKHHLIFKDEKSDKFWQIEVSGKSFTVTYGKSGSSGTSQTKTFDTPEQCLEEAHRLLAEKRKKGYETTDVPQKSGIIKFQLSEQFYSYMKCQLVTLDEKSVASKLSKADWNAYAQNAYNSILKHWAELQKNAKANIGSFIIGWNDGEDDAVDVDYVESNDIDFYSDGATVQMAFRVIEFNSFFTRVLKCDAEEIQDEDYFAVVKDLLCKLTQEVVQASTGETVFQEIPKNTRYKIWFYYWHDAEMIVIYDSIEGPKMIQDYYKKKDNDETATPDLDSFYSKYHGITIDGKMPENIGKASRALSATIKTQDEELPVGFGKLVNLQSLEITISRVQTFPHHICDFLKLEKLNFEAPLVSAIPNEIANLKQLEKLSIIRTNINQIPGNLGELKKLKTFKLMYNLHLKSLPKEIGRLAELQDLSVINCNLSHLDNEIFDGSKLNSMDFSQTQLTKLPETIGSLRWLRTLCLDGTEISSLPESIFDLKKLSYISLKGSKFTREKAMDISETFKSKGINVTIDV